MFGRKVAGILSMVWASVGGVAHAQNVSLYDVDNVPLRLTAGPFEVQGRNVERVFHETLRFDGASWLWLQFDRLNLDRGDYVQIVSHRDGTTQVITHTDPQYLDSAGGTLHSIIFGGDAVDLEIYASGTSRRTFMELGLVRVARYVGLPETQCGLNDDRRPTNPVDPCVVRIVDSNGGWGTGFMIGPNCMITAHHVMTNPPWSIQRNVPASNANGTINPPANPNDSFNVANLNGSTTSGDLTPGKDWAVVVVPNNAGGAPGANCNPTFNCTYVNTTAGATLRVRGFGIDSTPQTRNGVQQDHSGPSVAGGTNATHFRYRVDTEANNSGSPVTDSVGRIVGIHTDAGCLGNNPETGSNSGTLIKNPDLLAAIQNRCGQNICPSPPSGPCPCNNPPAGGGLGCDNFGAGPAQSGTLTASGTASDSFDTTAAPGVFLEATGENNTSLTVFWSGKPPASPTFIVHGAGLRCVTVQLKRFYMGNAAAGAITRPRVGLDACVSDRHMQTGAPLVPPETRLYFNIYRDPAAAGPCGNTSSTSNVTNAGSMAWVP